MKKKDWEKKPSSQIAVYKNNNSLLEIISLLKPSSPLFPWHLHAEKMKGEESRSLIRLVMLDYSGEDTKSVYANLRPEEIKFIYNRIANNVTEFRFNQTKIFPTEKNVGKVTQLFVNRQDIIKNQKQMYPWYFKIGNGTGTVAHNRNGGIFLEKDSYVEERTVSIKMSDVDVFILFSRANTCVEAFEHDALFHRRDIENLGLLVKQMKRTIEDMHQEPEPEAHNKAA